MSSSHLPRSVKEVFKFSGKDWFIFNGLIAFFRITGFWRYPRRRASGDIETMTFLDKVYWFYKARYPIRRARRNSGLEEYFAKQAPFHSGLPEGFNPTLRLTLSAAGDLMDNAYLPNSAETLYTEVFDTVFGADVSMANLECVIYSKSASAPAITPNAGPQLFLDPHKFNVIKGSGQRKFSFLATACNHSLDFGEAGVTNTVQTLQAEGIAFSGMNEHERDSSTATIIEKNGFKLGLVAYTFGLNAHKAPKEKPWIINRAELNGALKQLELSQIEEQLRYCRETKVDAAIIHLHWGLEHEFYPTPEQVELAHELAEMGFDAIIGHHPHVVQPAEYYRPQRDLARVVPIYYSLGNLVNPTADPVYCAGSVARITLAKGTTKDGAIKTYVENARLVEVMQVVDETTKKIRLVPAPR